MRLTLSRRQHHSAPDFEQERADLEQGRQNLMAAYRDYIDETMADEELSSAEKRARLETYKFGLIQAEEDYQEELRRLEEVQRLADAYGVPPESAEEAAEADGYLTFDEGQDAAAQPEPEEREMRNDGFSY